MSARRIRLRHRQGSKQISRSCARLRRRRAGANSDSVNMFRGAFFSGAPALRKVFHIDALLLEARDLCRLIVVGVAPPH